MDLTKYSAKLGSSSTSEAFINDTISLVNDDFDSYPTYRKIQLDGVAEECIFRTTKNSNQLLLWFRPQKVIDKGMYVLLDGNTYMVTDFIPNEVYPKAEIELCNNTLRWKDTLGTQQEYECIVGGNSISIKDGLTGDKRLVINSNADLKVSVQHNSNTKLIKVKERFLFGDKAFEVSSIDDITNVYNNKGYIDLVLNATEVTDTDNTTTGVADTSGNSGWSGW